MGGNIYYSDGKSLEEELLIEGAPEETLINVYQSKITDTYIMLSDAKRNIIEL